MSTVASVLCRWLTYCEAAGVAVKDQQTAPKMLVEELVTRDFHQEIVPLLPEIEPYPIEETQVLLLAAAVGNTFGGEGMQVGSSAASLARNLTVEYANIVRGTLISDHVEAFADGWYNAPESDQVRLTTGAASWCWWTSPNYINSAGSDEAGLWMTSQLFSEKVRFPATISLGWLCGEDASTSPIDLLKDAPRAPLRVTQTPDSSRTFTISSTQDFRELVDRFPLAIPQDSAEQTHHQLRDTALVSRPVDVLVDWPRAAERYDAVRMTCEGYMECAWLPLETTYGVTTATGWSPEATYWLQAPPLR
ncbi:MAG: hypothetical protein ACTHW1_01815 [Ancrocorticia sp.]|uniref:hypothetical protein n=1 Tax=Ancrocorticia sp. TaxID=2593684 RepID=UPI003F927638